MPPARHLAALIVSLAFLVPSAAAHHGDTDEFAEAVIDPLSPSIALYHEVAHHLHDHHLEDGDPHPMTPIVLYHHYVQIGMKLEEYQQRHPDKMQYKVIGHSVLGLEIHGVEITNFATEDPPIEDRKRLYFDGSIHSNEHLGMEIAIDIIHWLLEEYDSDPLAKFAVDNRRTFIVPLVNPDGNLRDSRQNTRSVDLNRNFPAGWGGPGSAARGAAPLSEPETQAVAKYLQEIVPHYSNSFHTGTLMLLHPYGNYTRGSDIVSPDHDLYTAICDEIRAAMAEAAGRNVPCGQVYSTIYPASGTTVDYVYDEFGSNSWTYEVDGQQNIPFSDRAIRERLGAAWISVRHAFEEVHRYGALLEILDVEPLVASNGVKGIQFTLHNVGMGNSSNAKAWVMVDEGHVALADVPNVATGQTRTVTLEFPTLPVGATATLAVGYNQTFYKGFYDKQRLGLKVVDLPEGGIGLITTAATEPLGDEVSEPAVTPGFEAVLLGLAAVGAAVVLRRRTA